MNNWTRPDTWIGLWLVYTAIVIPFATLVIRNYMLTIPDSIIDAAKLDGCSYLGIYGRIMLPLSVPALTVAFLFQFIWVWNDMIFGLVLTAKPIYKTINDSTCYVKRWLYNFIWSYGSWIDYFYIHTYSSDFSFSGKIHPRV